MATVQRLQTISIIYSVSDHRIYAIKFLDKDYINNFVQSASGLVDNSGISDSSTVIPFAIQYLNNTFSLNMSLAVQSDCYLASQGQDGLIPVYANDGSITHVFNGCKFVCVAVLSDFHESGSGGGGSSADYTDVLEDINNNLTALNTNIANKNNQSDIVSCLQDIFMYTSSDTNKKVSSMKCESVTVHGENYLKTVNVIFQLRKLVNCLSSLDRDFNQPVDNNNKEIYNISRKLANAVPNISDFDNKTILRVLDELSRKLSFDYPSSSASDVSLYKQLLNIKGSLKDGSDLHTISQAIDLISTAIAQSDQSQELGAIKDSINNLHLEQNNLIQVEGVLDYRLKPTDAE